MTVLGSRVEPAGRVEQVVAAALCRAVLLARAAVALAAAAAGLVVVDAPERVLALLAAVAFASAGQLVLLTRRPATILGHPVAWLAVDSLAVVVVLVLSHGGLAYVSYAAGSAALAGVLLGPAAIPLWAAQLVQGFAVSARVLTDTRPPAAVATFLLAAPVAALLAGVGAMLVARTLSRQLRLAVGRVASAQRSAAALERARLARELHDSVAKTLRGISLAALALPGSLRRQPVLAEQLAGVISSGAAAADREARELLEGLRLDSPDEDFGHTIGRLCQSWSAQTGIGARSQVAALDLPVPVRYELARITHEALTNVARHSAASMVAVTVARRDRSLTLSVRDNGMGFVVPPELGALQRHGHLGVVGMVERAQSVGGRLEVESTPGAGTTVRVWVPLP